MSIISIRSVETLLKKSGCKRLNKKAVNATLKLLEDYANKIGKTAWKYALHAKRRTLLLEDVELVKEILK